MSDSKATVKQVGGKRDDLTHDPRKLKLRRVAARLSVTKLAALAGCSKAHLSMLEDGQHGASPEMLGRFADALGCRITDLMPDEASNGSAA